MQVPLFPQLSQSDTKSRCILSFQGLGLSFEARTCKVCALTLLCLRLGAKPFGLLDRKDRLGRCDAEGGRWTFYHGQFSKIGSRFRFPI